MLDKLERFAVYLHGLRWWFFALCAGAFIVLAILDFRGHEVIWPFILSFMWLFGIAMFVESFQRTKRLEEAKYMEDVGPRFMYKFFTPDAFACLTAWFFVFWLGFLTSDYRPTCAILSVCIWPEGDRHVEWAGLAATA